MAKSFRVHQLEVRQATDGEDRAGADAFLNNLGVGHRQRGLNVNDYHEISVRKVDGYRAEYDKILAGESLADIQIHEFDDAYIISATEAIKAAIEAGKWRVGKPNKDQDGNRDGTRPVYININDIVPHIEIRKHTKDNDHG